MQVVSIVKLLGMAHWDIPPSHQVRHNPGSRGCPKIFQFREIIRTLPGGTSLAYRGIPTYTTSPACTGDTRDLTGERRSSGHARVRATDIRLPCQLARQSRRDARKVLP